jgi:hypothetical protein
MDSIELLLFEGLWEIGKSCAADGDELRQQHHNIRQMAAAISEKIPVCVRFYRIRSDIRCR